MPGLIEQDNGVMKGTWPQIIRVSTHPFFPSIRLNIVSRPAHTLKNVQLFVYTVLSLNLAAGSRHGEIGASIPGVDSSGADVATETPLGASACGGPGPGIHGVWNRPGRLVWRVCFFCYVHVSESAETAESAGSRQGPVYGRDSSEPEFVLRYGLGYVKRWKGGKVVDSSRSMEGGDSCESDCGGGVHDGIHLHESERQVVSLVLPSVIPWSYETECSA